MKFLLFSFLSTFTMIIVYASNPFEEKVIFWDASLSMKTYDKSRVISELSSMINHHPNINIRLVVFSNQIISDDRLTVINGNWQDLQTRINAIIYDGSTNFDCIKPLLNAHLNYLLVTDKQYVTHNGKISSGNTKKYGKIIKLAETSNNNTTNILSGRVFLNGFPVEAEIKIKGASANSAVKSAGF